MHTRKEYDALIPEAALREIHDWLAENYKGQDLHDAIEDVLEEQYQEYLDNLEY